MRIAIGGFFHESNTFCRPLTTLADYERTGLYRGAKMIAPRRNTDTEVGGFLAAADELGFEVVPTVLAWAWPGGPLEDACFRAILDEVTTSLRAAFDGPEPPDGVLFQLHGAMVTESDEDPDGTILTEVRAALPPGIPLVVTFDMHANLSPLMVSRCDALIGYNTYPHVDLHAVGREAAQLLVRMLQEEIRPVMSLSKPPLMPHIVRQRTADGPMSEMMALAREAERTPGMLRVSVAAGFPYADVPRMGMGVLAISEGDPDVAADVAETLAAEAWARREAFMATLPDAATAVAEALSTDTSSGPVVLADVADNVGGGAPGDGTFLLAALLRAQSAGQTLAGCVVMLADPEAVAACIHAGVRATLDVTVGGKVDRLHGEPVTVTGRVRALTDGVFRNIGPMRDGLVDDMGRVAVMDVDGLTLILTERKLPMWNLEQLRSLGIEPTRQRLIVCKGAVAHRAAYLPIASRTVEVETPGSCAGDVRSFQYRNIRRPLFPLDRW